MEKSMISRPVEPFVNSVATPLMVLLADTDVDVGSLRPRPVLQDTTVAIKDFALTSTAVEIRNWTFTFASLTLADNNSPQVPENGITAASPQIGGCSVGNDGVKPPASSASIPIFPPPILPPRQTVVDTTTVRSNSGTPAGRSIACAVPSATVSVPGYLTPIKIIPRPSGVGRDKLETVLEKLGWDLELYDFVKVSHILYI
jgi:hypothetical protein